MLVIAGAGSGKTRTIVYRLAHLVRNGVAPENILLLTFTRKAAQEMQDRAELLLEGGLAGVTGGTFHAFAFSMLRRFPGALDEAGRVSIMDQGDAENALRDIKSDLGMGKGDRSFPKKSTLMGLISKSRNKELALSAVLQNEAFHMLRYEGEIEQLAKAYAVFKKRHGLYDYDDLLFGLERLLRDHEPARDFARSRFKYVMVDEFQDTNLVQARIVKLLGGKSGNVMAVGDDAQSIYAFRGANVHNILSFEQMFDGAKLIRLEQNYRSTQPILDLTNALLEQAELKIRKNLFTERKDSHKPQMVRTISDRSQAQAVVSKVLEFGRKFPLHEVAVLFRAGYQSYSLEVALNKLGIRFQKFGGIRFTEAAHIRDALSFLRLMQNPSDIPAWQRVFDHVKGVGPKTCAKIFAAVMDGDKKYLTASCKRNPQVNEVLDFLDGLRTQDQRPSPLLGRVLEFYQPILEKKFADDYPRRQSGLEQLQRIAAGYENLDGFLGDISLENPEPEKDTGKEDTLVLSTVHSAKGLEWSAVVIIDLVQDRFPSRHALQRAEDLEEERRLLYVACTRAKDRLALFVPSVIYNQYNGTSEPALESPFLSELPLSTYEAWRENYSGGLARVDGGTTRTPEAPASSVQSSTAKHSSKGAGTGPTATGNGPTQLGYCRHKIFGRGKVIATVGEGKFRINFPGFGLKVILADYLEME
ncbi:DNA/RNA helicase, superfamily I [Desulfovibrio ferrophilus]|uniref:DNA 3'-5' helicase n=1 Tax=Desulfovibrio ferrophilus TaxID=241368 RepID=A0A2Z6B3K3_9BACT|nr:DNA/RNA helicase, superfamily I [Desulfovibrio ferrophilus]